MVVAQDASRFVLGTQEVELGPRAQLSRVLEALTTARIEEPGEWVACPRLIGAVWQGERMRPQSAMNRLHVAIATLRKMGLRPVLQSKRGAYRLRSDIELARA